MLIEGMFHLNFSLSSSFVSWSTLPLSVKQVDIDRKEEGRNEAKTLKKKIKQILHAIQVNYTFRCIAHRDIFNQERKWT